MCICTANVTPVRITIPFPCKMMYFSQLCIYNLKYIFVKFYSQIY